jgi:hypothetical protein
MKTASAPLVIAAGTLLSLGCQSDATKRCQALLTSALPGVTNVDAKTTDAVHAALDASEAARAACAEAGRQDEHDQLLKAKNQLVGHLDYMKKHANAKENAKLTPEQIETLVKQGDPDCPKGQAYKHHASGKEIRCRGPQIVDLGYASAKEYWEGRGFKTKASTSPPSLTFEYGAELYVYEYDSVGDTRGPGCLTMYPAPGIPWIEATARATGVQPRLLMKENGTVQTARGRVPLVVDEGESKLTIFIGACEKAPPPAPSASQ